MITLEIQLLTGRYVATAFSERAAAEWPPHPARLYSALVATAHEHEELTAPAQEALEWLEQQGAPEIEASEAETRSAVSVYVPENQTRVLEGWRNAERKLEEARHMLEEMERSGDAKALAKASKAVVAAEKRMLEQIAKAVSDDGKGNAEEAYELLPERRGKQPKTLPSVIPHHPRVRYHWPRATPEFQVAATLAELGRRLVRLGHSSSLVTCRLIEGPNLEQPPAVPLPGYQLWKPTDEGENSMRTVEEGQWNRLERAFARHQGFQPRVLPAVHQSYRVDGGKERVQPPRSVFGEWIVLREIPGESDRRVGLRLQRTEDITRAVRGALLHHAQDPTPSVLNGHESDGRPIERPHVAYVPLADVGSKYASGTVLGVAILLPRGLENEERRAVLRAIGRWEKAGLRLLLGRTGALHLERVMDSDPRKTLEPTWWTRSSRRWASVTPVALDKNPGNLLSHDPKELKEAAARAEEIVQRSCERIGLPAPRWVEIVRRSLFDAAPAARDYMPFPRKGSSGNGLRRVCVHVEMCFDEPVAGPVLIGAGRYFGLGLCRGRE